MLLNVLSNSLFQNATWHSASVKVQQRWSWAMTIEGVQGSGYMGYMAVDDIQLVGCESRPTSSPSITIPPKPIVGNYLSEGVTYCMVDGNPQPTVSWLQKNMLIHKDSSRFVRLKTRDNYLCLLMQPTCTLSRITYVRVK